MLDKLQKESFAPHVNTVFEIHAQGMGAVSVELVELTGKKTDYTDMFSAIFKGPKGPVVPQGIHTFKHPQMGEVEMFMTPVMYPKQDGIYYQVIFNRLVKPLTEEK